MVLHLVEQASETHNATIVVEALLLQTRHVVVVVGPQTLPITVKTLGECHVPDVLRIQEVAIAICGIGGIEVVPNGQVDALNTPLRGKRVVKVDCGTAKPIAVRDEMSSRINTPIFKAGGRLGRLPGNPIPAPLRQWARGP